MKKTTLLWGALLAAFALQACSNTEDSAKTDPAASETPSDTNPAGDSQWNMPDAGVVANGMLALGGDGQVVVDTQSQNGLFIGIGITDATLCGDGRTAGCNAACPEPCIAPGYPAGCGACPSRGTWAAGIITANLTLNNTTGSGTYGSCSLQDLSVCTNDATNECIPNGTVNSCDGHPVTSGGTLANADYYLGSYDTIPAGIMAGYCKDAASTPCAAANSDGGGLSKTCNGLGTCSDNAANCTPGPDGIFGNVDDVKTACGNPLTATCAPGNPGLNGGARVADGKCWSGCGTCTPGRAFNCAEFVYTGSNTNAGASTGDLKCTGGPYTMANPEIGGNTIALGTVAQGGNVAFQFQLNSTDNSYCLHRFIIRDDPYGDLAGQGCTATCGDGVIAGTNGPEVCEKKYDPTDLTPPFRMVGCTDGNEFCTTSLGGVACGLCTPYPVNCGNGSLDAGEACDDGALNGTTTCGCDNSCQFPTVVCRASAGACDVAESCSAGSCPADGFAANTVVCRASAGACDVAENCDGVSAACPVDAVAPNTTVCRASAGVCDVAENCDGAGTACPADAFSPGTTVCRASVDVPGGGFCDPAENCTGSSAACPADTTQPNGSLGCTNGTNEPDTDTCQGGICTDPLCGNGALNAGEACDTGVNNGTTTCGCQTNCQFAPNTTGCRAAAGVCDVAENCDGAGACAADAFAPNTTVCRPSAGVCDVAENCTGSAAACPADVFSPNTTVCRASAGVCDVAENCDGVSAACPADAFSPNTTVCRVSAGVCDVAENCTGSAAACPADVFSPNTTVCRASAGVCDVAENCTGASAACPADAFAPNTTVCRADADGASPAGGCDTAENCTGASATCPADTCNSSGLACNGTGTCGAGCVCAAPGGITSVTPIKGVSADTYAYGGTACGGDGVATGDYNNGMTTGAGSVEWYAIMPNDPQVTSPSSGSVANGGRDRVWATVTFASALVGGDVVTCNVNPGAIAMNVSDCATGDSSCIVYGNFPELTAVVSDGQTNGAVTGTFPDEISTARAITVDCQLNAGATVSAAGEVALGFIGVQDATLPAAGGTLNAQVLVYCANGATQACSDALSGGDATVGVRAQSLTLHYNSTRFTGVTGATPPAVRANPANAYGVPSNAAAPCTGVTAAANCTQVSPGFATMSGSVINSACTGWMLAHVGSCNLTAAAAPAGTYTTIDTTALSGDLVFYIAGGQGFPIRGLDGGTFCPLPSTNVSGQFIYQ